MATSKIPMINGNKILWTGSFYMSEAHEANLSEPISKQRNGIVLVWSAYTNGSPQNYDFVYHYVPKYHISIGANQGVDFWLSTPNIVGQKYLYISDSKIKGYTTNDETRTAAGTNISMQNDYWVLRAVIGV